MTVELYYGDCINYMGSMSDCTVDLTVTSPPYDDLRTYENTIDAWNKETWKKILLGLYRITKIGGVVVWIVSDATIKGDETGSSFLQALWAKKCGFNLHDTMIWVKDGGGAVGSNYCYTQNFEYMFVFSKGMPKTYNLIKDKPNKSYGKDKSGVGRRLKNGEHKIESRKPSEMFSRRNNWWYTPPEKGEHPAVFPIKLIEDHIITWSNEGDLVFDPMMGSATTGEACIKTNRNFKGCEKVLEYFNISEKRIADAQAQPRLFTDSKTIKVEGLL